jgi:hypothetical protein
MVDSCLRNGTGGSPTAVILDGNGLDGRGRAAGFSGQAEVPPLFRSGGYLAPVGVGVVWFESA